MTLFICTILITTSFSAYAISENSISLNFINADTNLLKNVDIYEWSDGEFIGDWISHSDNDEGLIKGYIKQGRSPYIGIIVGEWENNQNTKGGLLKGFYRNNILWGIINSFDYEKNSLFYGFLIFNDSNFHAKIIHKQAIISINGSHLDSFLPMLTGEFNVGVKSLHLIDENRYELFTSDDPDDLREVMVQIWYPVDKNNVADRIDYMDDLTFQWLFDRSPIPLATIPNNAYEYVRPYSYDKPPIASIQENFPLIIFSHGYDGVYQIYTSLIEDLVSHGFIVASINHPYIAGIVVFPNGDVIRVTNVDTNISLPSVVGDIKFVLDELIKINNNDNFFKGKFNFTEVGLYGHSFGGAATVICCYDDPRIKAGLTLDGYFSEEFLSERIPEDFDKPILMMMAEGRLSDPGSDYIWNLLDDDVYKVEVIGSTHYGYTDVGILLDHFVPLIPSKPLGFGTINPKRLNNITKSYEIAFFETYLKNNSIDKLIDLASIFDEVVFVAK